MRACGFTDRRQRTRCKGRRRSRHRWRASLSDECHQRCAASAQGAAAHRHAIHAGQASPRVRESVAHPHPEAAAERSSSQVGLGQLAVDGILSKRHVLCQSPSIPRLKKHRRSAHIATARAKTFHDRMPRITKSRKERFMNIKVGKQAIAEASKKLSNWGRWGKEDQIGTLNHVTPEDIVKAANLIRSGKVFALGIPLDREGPQTGLFGGRFNPIHQMLATGTDAIAGRQAWNKIRYADDTLMLCVQGATHWDAPGHLFYQDKAYNGHDAKLIDAKGLNVLGIEHSKSKMVGRGVLLDIARFRGVPWMKDGESI